MQLECVECLSQKITWDTDSKRFKCDLCGSGNIISDEDYGANEQWKPYLLKFLLNHAAEEKEKRNGR